VMMLRMKFTINVVAVQLWLCCMTHASKAYD